MMCATSDESTKFNISKNLLGKVGLQSLVHYVQKTNLKQGAHIQKPMIRAPHA